MNPFSKNTFKSLYHSLKYKYYTHPVLTELLLRGRRSSRIKDPGKTHTGTHRNTQAQALPLPPKQEKACDSRQLSHLILDTSLGLCSPGTQKHTEDSHGEVTSSQPPWGVGGENVATGLCCLSSDSSFTTLQLCDPGNLLHLSVFYEN